MQRYVTTFNLTLSFFFDWSSILVAYMDIMSVCVYIYVVMRVLNMESVNLLVGNGKFFKRKQRGRIYRSYEDE